jgi:hypothetical protein
VDQALINNIGKEKFISFLSQIFNTEDFINAEQGKVFHLSITSNALCLPLTSPSQRTPLVPSSEEICAYFILGTHVNRGNEQIDVLRF